MKDYSEMSTVELDELADELEAKLKETDDAEEEMRLIDELETISDFRIDAEEREWDEEYADED